MIERGKNQGILITKASGEKVPFNADKLRHSLHRSGANNESINRQTNWYVITGGPSSGKTTTVTLLKERGYITTMEHARHFLDTQRLKGRTIQEVRENQREFQLGVLDMQIEQENEISPDV